MQFWWWLLQRVSGLLLLVLLGTHLVLTHFIAPAEAVQFAAVQGRFSMTLVPILDYSLLFVALLHGLYGMFVVIGDLLPAIQPKVLAFCLIVIGVGLGIVGAYTLSVFLV